MQIIAGALLLGVAFLFAIVLFIVLISYQPSVVPFACFVVYAISGFIWSGWLALKRRRS